jgi:hypothetical protein
MPNQSRVPASLRKRAKAGYNSPTTGSGCPAFSPRTRSQFESRTAHSGSSLSTGQVMIRKFNLIFGYLGWLVLTLCFSTIYSQPRATQELSPAAAVLTSSAVRAIVDEPPRMRPGPALIIRRFVTAETQFRQTMIQFSFKRDVELQTIGPQGEVTGEYIRNSVFVLDDRGQRFERVLYHPKSTITELTITKEDIADLAGSQLFGLELADLSSYALSYLGEETIDGRPMCVVGVSPNTEPDPRHMHARFFVGRFWIDPVSFQPVYVEGITEPHGKQRFPSFKTERSASVENFLFPASTYADEVLRFPHKDVHFRIKARYYDFKRFTGRVKIVELGESQSP